MNIFATVFLTVAVSYPRLHRPFIVWLQQDNINRPSPWRAPSTLAGFEEFRCDLYRPLDNSTRDSAGRLFLHFIGDSCAIHFWLTPVGCQVPKKNRYHGSKAGSDFQVVTCHYACALQKAALWSDRLPLNICAIHDTDEDAGAV